uniref:Zinc finger protein SNAI2 n=1 Tax=Sphaeramia orbicularis TaxID=375764 RepID=A0A673B0U5_9TELE
MYVCFSDPSCSADKGAMLHIDIPFHHHPSTPGSQLQQKIQTLSFSSSTPWSLRAGCLNLPSSPPLSMLAPSPEPEPAESYTKLNLENHHVTGNEPRSESLVPRPLPLFALLPGVCPGSSSSNQDSFECVDCQKEYLSFSGLAKHKQLQCEWSSKKYFSCKYCEKEYVSLGALKMHIRTHTLPCVCKLCGKAFSRPWLLQGHIRTHTGEKPFSCLHCSRAFADRSNLRAHLQTHSEVKKYQCGSCFKTFSRISLLAKHQETGCPLS